MAAREIQIVPLGDIDNNPVELAEIELADLLRAIARREDCVSIARDLSKPILIM